MSILSFILAILLLVIGVPVGIIWLIVALCTKRKIIAPLIIAGGCFVGFLFLMLVTIISIPSSDDDSDDTSNQVVENVKEGNESEDDGEQAEVVTAEEYKALCKEYNYKDVLRNPENYVGEKVKITVEISSVHEESWLNDTKYYFAYSESEYGYYGDQYAIFDTRESDDLKLLEDDIIVVYGEIAETEHTESLIVNSEEVFAINMKYVELIGE